jgi:type IV secretory pathway VirB4 component
MAPIKKLKQLPGLINTPETSPQFGIYLGGETYWNPELLANPHGLIIGNSGAGKTQCIKSIAYEVSNIFNSDIFIIDFHGDQQIPGEKLYSIGLSTACGINPFIFDKSSDTGGYRLHSIYLSEMFSKKLRLGINQQSIMLEIILECYESRKINDNPLTWQLEAPNVKDLENIISLRIEDGCKESGKLYLKLKTIFEYAIFSRKQPDLYSGGIIRFDLSLLAKAPTLQSIAAQILCKQLYDHSRILGEMNSKIPRYFIFIDEAKEVRGEMIIDRIIADGRKYGLALWLASQRPVHISAEVISNSQTKIILPVDSTDINSTSRQFRFSPDEVASLTPLVALIRLGQKGSKVRILPFYQRVA